MRNKVLLKRLVYVVCVVLCIVSLKACGTEKHEKNTLFTSIEEANTSTEMDVNSDTEEAEYTIGVVDNNVYTNETYGFSITLPDGWGFLSADEIDEYDGGLSYKESDEEAQECLKEGSAYMEIYGVNNDSGENIFVTILGKSSDAWTKYSKNELMDAVASEAKTQLEVDGATVYYMGVEKINIDGRDDFIIKIDEEFMDRRFFQYQLYLVDSDYLCFICASGNNDADNYFDMIKWQ